MSNSGSFPWLLPFVLGAASALAANQLLSLPSSKKTTKRKTYVRPEINEELMDAADLDHRMLRKAEAVIQWRTTRLVLVIERCTNDHNYSAILRTAEALGIQLVYMIDPPEVRDEEDLSSKDLPTHMQISRSEEEIKARRAHHLFARNATEWLDIKDFETAEDCVAELKKQGYQLWVTDLSQEAQCLTMNQGPTVPEKIALVMGTEAVGCSQYMLEQADLRVYLPLRGFADSLNLSVATALILHQLFCMDPTLVGGISEEEKLELRRDWYTKLCSQRILTPSQKKQRLRLQNNIKKCQSIIDKQKSTGKPLQPGEEKKLAALEQDRQKLAELDALVDPVKLQMAVQKWVENPPAPLSDMRRCDAHRICFVGKNTRKFHEDHWKDMVATSDSTSVYGATSKEFRKQVQEQN